MSNRQKSYRIALAGLALILISSVTFASPWSAAMNWLGLDSAPAENNVSTQPADVETVGTCDVANAGLPIEIDSTGGVVVPTAYANLGAAIAAINAGTHQGVINVEVCFNSVETGASFINSNAAAPASYTAINIYPLADGVTISGPTVTGRGLIELNGADSVTIDGDNPNTAGTNRNLTITNTAAVTVNLTSVIRIAVIAAVPTADNNTFRNLNINGSATGRNAAANTSTTASENSSFGIYAGGLATTATAAPAPLTSVSTNTAASGTTINALNITNNAVNACARAIFFNGAASSVSTGVTIANNLVGDQATVLAGTPPYIAPTTTVYTKPIFVAGTNSFSITGNSVKNILSYVGTSMIGIEINSAIGTGPLTISNNTVDGVVNNGTASGAFGIGFNSAATGATFTVSGNTVNNIQAVGGVTIYGIQLTTTGTPVAALVEKNRVSTVYSRGSGGFGSYGINLNGGNAVTVQNNFVWDINAFLNNSAISSSFGPHGIRIASGINHKIYHNSVNLFGAHVGSSSTSLSSAFTIISTGTTLTGLDVRNNIFANTMTGAFSASTPVVAMFLPSGGTSAMNLTLNNNDYFQGSGTGAAIAQVGTTSGTGVYLAADFNAGATTPAANLRSYTSTLSAAGTNDNASKVADPLFISNTNLHIQTSSTMESGGANLGVATDIDGDARSTVPDIGADEITIIAPGALQMSSATYSGLEGGTANATVNRVAGSTGTVGVTYTLADVSAVGGAACTAGVDYINPGPQLLSFGNGVTSQPIVVTLCADAGSDPGETFTITLSAPTGGATLGSPTVSTVTIQDVAPPFNGTFTVGTGGNYPSLTNPGGIFEAINLSGATGNITINIISDLAGETGTHPLNEIAGGFTVLIKPSGAPRAITGSSATSLIKLNGSDGVTIDGSTSGGTDRSLTITNSGAGAILWIATNATSGANTNTLKNTNAIGAGSFSGQGVIASSGTTFGGAAEFPNSNNTLRNNAFSRVQNALFASGNTITPDQNWTVADNSVGSAVVADKLSFRGFFLGFSQNFLITNNAISGINSSTGTSSTMSGIQLNGTLSGSVTRNIIKDIKHNNTTGWGSNGIFLTGAAGSSVTIANNFISDVASQGFNGQAATDNGYGISVDTGSGYNIWHNTIVLNTNQGAGAAAGHTAPILLTSTHTSTGGVDLRNNILVSTQTLGTRYGVIDMATTGAAAFSNINRNDYFAQNVGRIGATTHATLAAWQGATGQDANSRAEDPLFVSATDFHLQGGSPELAAATLIAGIDNDFDNDLRDDVPDIGADEVIGGGRSGTIPAGTYRDGKLLSSTLGGNVDFTGTVTLGGVVFTGANTLGIQCGGNIAGASPTAFIIGNLRRDFCGTGGYAFPVGSVGNGSAFTDGATPEGFTAEYSPMTATVNSGTFPSSLTVNVVDTWLPNLGQTSSISRYWNVTETGDVNVDMLFQYLPEDVYGDEPNYKPFKWDGATTTQQPGSVDPPNNQFTATGVTSFSGWAAGVRNVTASTASISGRVTTAGGNGIRNANMILTGNSLPAPLIVQTGSFGTYSFDNLRVGETYVLQVGAKRFRFTNPTHVITLQGDITDMDFVANPQE